MSYIIAGLDPAPFAALFTETKASLAARNIAVVTAEGSGYPCRISLDEAAPGDQLLLLNHVHQPAATPYQSRHAIYVAKGSRTKAIYRNSIPPVMRTRLLSIRAFDAQHMMLDADVTDGAVSEPLITRLLENPAVDYLHVHFAKRGCFAAIVTRGD